MGRTHAGGVGFGGGGGMVAGRMKRRGLMGVMLAVAALAAGPASRPTTTTTGPTTARVKAAAAAVRPPAASPIDLSRVATEAEKVDTLLRRVTVEAEVDRTPATVREDLPSLTVEIAARRDETIALLSSRPTLQVLDGLADDWQTIDRTLAGWDKAVSHRKEVLAGLVQPAHVDDKGQPVPAGQLLQKSEDWGRARDFADYLAEHPVGGDQLMRDRMYDASAKASETIQAIGQTTGSLQIELTATYGLLRDVDEQKAAVAGVLDLVRRARDEAWDRLFQRDGEPVWRLGATTSAAAVGPASAAAAKAARDVDSAVVRQGQGGIDRQWQAVRAYLWRHRANAAAHALLVGVVAAALLVGRRWVRRWAEADPSLNRAMLAFTAPIATAVVLSFLAGVWIYPQAPRLFWAGFGAVVLVPTVFLLRRVVEPGLFRILYGLVGFYAADQVRLVTASQPRLARGLFLGEMLAGVVVLGLLIWSRRGHRPSTWGGWGVRIGTRVWAVVFAACGIADAVGFVSLGELVGGAALSGAYLAVILYACTRIVGGLLLLVVRSRPLTLLNGVRRHQPLMVRRLGGAIQWLAAGFWLVGVLELLAARPAVFEALRYVWNLPVYLGSIRVTPSHGFVFGLTVYAAVLVSRFVRFVLDEDVYTHVTLATGLAYTVNRMVHYGIVLAGFYLAMAAAGVSFTQLGLLVTALTVGLGFGLQNVVNNFVSGLILLFERPIKVGDLVELGGTTGTVEYIGIRASTIRTPESSEVIVPNGNLLSNQLTNWTLTSRQRGVSVPMSLGADADPQRVMRLLTDVAASHPLVVTQPPPQALLVKFAGDSFAYELRAWTNSAEQWLQLRSDLAVSVHAMLVREGIAVK